MLKKRLGIEAIERDWNEVFIFNYFKIPSTLTISESCEKIGDYAFAGCWNAKVIVGPRCRVKDVGRNAFKDCIVKYKIC